MPKYLVSNMLGSQQTYTNFLWNCCGHHMPEWPKRQLCQHPLSARFFAYFGADRRPWVGGLVSLLVLREQEPVYYHLINEHSWTAVHVVTMRTRRACEADYYTYTSAELKICSDHGTVISLIFGFKIFNHPIGSGEISVVKFRKLYSIQKYHSNTTLHC